MGFGIIILGYILTLLDTFGGGIVGCPLMAYGFYRASRVNSRFGICSIISLISLYEPVLQVMAIFKVINSESAAFSTAHLVSYFVKLALIFTFYTCVVEIAREGKAEKLEKGAMLRLYFNCAAFGFMIISAFADLSGMQLFINIAYVVAGVINILFLWDCASKITTREQMTKDRLALKRIDDEERKKKEKRDKKASLSKNSSGK